MEKNDNPEHELISRFLSSDAREDEKFELERWADASEENRRYLDELVFLWELSESVKSVSSIEVAKDWEKVRGAINHIRETEIEKPQPQRHVHPAVRIAAVIILGVAFYFLYRISPLFTKPTVVATTNNKTETLLPDGTKVFLNKNTSLTYTRDFGDQSREVVLHGEAFFEVKKDQSRPFLIKSGNSITEVVGTSFNVDETDSSGVIVTVSSGKVLFYPVSDKQERITLLPGEQGILDSVKQPIRKPNEDMNVLAWKTGVLSFRNTPLPQVIHDLNRCYGQNIQLKGGSNHCTLTSTFQGQSLEDVLIELTLVLPIRIEREDAKLVITATDCTD